MGVELNINGTRYRIVSDLHTHTIYSHGKGTIEENVKAAVSKGLKQIGIADHGPGHLGFGVSRKKLAEMKAEILRVRRGYPEIEILFGVEANIIAPQGRLDIRPDEFDYFNYICAGWHYGAVDGLSPAGIINTLVNLTRNTAEKASSAQIKRNTDAVCRAISAGGLMFLTHPADKAPVDLLEVAAGCARTDTLVEINTSHMSLTADDIRAMQVADIRFIIGSDAHTPERVGDFLPAIELIANAELDPARVVNLEQI